MRNIGFVKGVAGVSLRQAGVQQEDGRQGGEMAVRKMAEPVLNQMQMLDQQVAPSRPVPEQLGYLSERIRIDLPSLGGRLRLAAAGTGMENDPSSPEVPSATWAPEPSKATTVAPTTGTCSFSSSR